MKRLLLAMMFVLSLLAIPAMADSDNYDFDNVYVNGINLDDATVYVERGENVDIYVYFTGTGDTTDVNVKAWIGGYEYDNVQATSGMFDVEDGISYRQKLSLELPEDLNAEQEYTLYVEIYDDVDSETYTADLLVSRERHLLSIVDVLTEDVDAGDYTTVTVRLSDMGDHKEEDIKVTVSVPELGIEKSTFLDELTSDEIDNEDEESSEDVSLTFQIPECAENGEYEVDVTVEYNNGYSSLEESTSLSVEAQQH
ncbi:hypothetical protein J4467_03345 [Candidatus Woesearchaeota archaeon]|nr:hypothetical protein [Candidatus Woesearchaeota archaeon]